VTDNIEEKALALIKSKPRGILQSELWKDLEIDSRKCSRVVAKLEAEGKVKRTWETVSGTRTYRLSYVETKIEAPKKEYRFDLIMAEDVVAPCVGCTYECEPDYCPDLGEWIELLTQEEARRPSKAAREKAVAVEAEAPAEEEVEEIEVPVARPAKAAKAAKKGKAVPEPEPEEEEEVLVKPAKKGKKAVEPEVKQAKMGKTAAKKKAVPEPEEEEEAEEVKPVKKSKPRSKK
jgi:DNA-binding Lrp family transcriptional regulator